MNPNLLLQFRGIFSISFFFINIYCLERTAIAADPKIGDCEPKSCGSIKNISYPFWIEGQQPDYCGFPTFIVNCSDDIPYLQTAYGDRQILGIFYNNESIWLSEAKLSDYVCSNSSSIDDFSFAGTPFSISAVNKKLLLLHNCRREQTGSFELPCNPNKSYAAYIGDDYSKPDPQISGDCPTTKVPVLGFAGAESRDYKALLEHGYLLDWEAPNCTECRASKGQCGYDHSENAFMCICRDRIHRISCKKKSKSWRKIAIGVGAGVGAIIVASLLCLAWYKHRKRKQRSTSSILLGRTASSEPCFKNDPELGKSEYQTTIFTYEELEEATNCFSASKELGDGGFGTVYKGKLRDGRVVAVKRLYEHNYRRVEQFMNEVKILSCLRHQNLVSLYGCTSRHSRELLLVYEYVSNGTVSDHLHGPRAQEGGLTWPIRLSIAIETADALGYLHAVEPQIIHRDVKTNNILLDDSFHVKVADFGLSRLFPLDATHVSTAPQGTPGYVDPEYHQCYQLTDKSDVYSFGVVLAELISSKPAVDTNRTRHEINLANMATTKIQNCQLDQLVDPSLGYQTDWEMKTMITLVAELAFRCLQLEREMRPSIKEALEVLREIESGEYKTKKVVDTDVPAKEDASLLKNILPYSPDAVTERWESRSTTPNTSG
ncbi:LEAF RUST 10 DISEASE-RESISTANCE LOCUS RECEPTOR-LIKE PROTEIN KINASE-like 1.2 isoform X3 [Phoenix dactylifera]|uniref:non-specific serine/threonine protein kinase n=1 Tax=Phoenix dactylifera TaxID=42345 RepID=A0A8B9AE60_PHODC|nr:LEAF RUST 10 DISEASE-RESISTANCE LOCUS RECEPTOR-LIKE PROTEIN KINASE-like 1.2 isoform X3 [Phoenix dactylifera]